MAKSALMQKCTIKPKDVAFVIEGKEDSYGERYASMKYKLTIGADNETGEISVQGYIQPSDSSFVQDQWKFPDFR